MRREERLKKFDMKTRNKIRAILSEKDGNAIVALSRLYASLNKMQAENLDSILNSHLLTKAVRFFSSFPKTPPFKDTLQANFFNNLAEILKYIEGCSQRNNEKLKHLIRLLQNFDELYSKKEHSKCIELIEFIIEQHGWSHVVLRKLILLRENIGQDETDERIEQLVIKAGIKGVVVSSLIHTFTRDQNILMSKRSVLNITDRGVINRYTRTLSKLSIQPFATSIADFEVYLKEVIKCSLIDAIIFIKFNRHLMCTNKYPVISELVNMLGSSLFFEELIKNYDASSSESEYAFFKQSSAWLEYDAIREYRVLIDNYYDSSTTEKVTMPHELKIVLEHWVGNATLEDLVSGKQFTNHQYPTLARLEINGNVTRSALFNYWLTESEGQIAFEKENLFTLMGLTRDLARTIPINPARTAAKLAKDVLVKLILLLLLAKRSKNELDSFLLRKLLEDVTLKNYDGSLVNLVENYEKSHPYISEYIYDIATEDFLAKLTKLAPHRSDIPEIRASLHEWMARFTNEKYYLQRARAVRIDHQINRVRNEIDDHRIYVDPMRFTSWIEDEMMIELNGALTSTGSGKKGKTVTCDESIISMVITQSYNSFCTNPVFGIASYIGRRIRHGTFHGQLYSSVINKIETNTKYERLFAHSGFKDKWNSWKEAYNYRVEDIISERLHVYSKTKPLGLLTPELYTPKKQDVLSVAVAKISAIYAETTSSDDLCPIIIDYCWRLAELDLISVIHFLKAQQTPLKNQKYIEEELMPIAVIATNNRMAESFRRELELSIDRKLATMLGWFKRPSIIAPQASVSLLFAATVAEVKDTIPDFDPQNADYSREEIELVGNFYHLIYDSLAIVVGNAAKYADRTAPLIRNFEIVTGKNKQLVIEISSKIKPTDNPHDVSCRIENFKKAGFLNANLYDKNSGIAKLLLLANNRKDFELAQYEVVGREVKVRLIYALEH
ncbi:hypothetical protein KSGM81_04542 [Klebsiella quasipneumoniae]|uniref:hypothetical protein n=1 Tax=Klebsiella quasipneumoniae TaxID=1463165 RepID=UPI00111B729D|nr:hypothetical protein [Klebsiella quasipneumoniae]SNQ41575.1 hypothetical protein KSGM81_04542 [Klebsiella quasipneumoniae]HCB1270129.1 hypothetical protein [Klebsiella quasipneumoniae subsp. quasipneumoniae]